MDDGIRPIDENGASELVFERVELGEERDLEERPLKSKVINAGVLVVAALISLLLLANIASSPSTYSGMYETLDEKKLNVMGWRLLPRQLRLPFLCSPMILAPQLLTSLPISLLISWLSFR